MFSIRCFIHEGFQLGRIEGCNKVHFFISDLIVLAQILIPDPTLICDPRSWGCDPWSHIPHYDPAICRATVVLQRANYLIQQLSHYPANKTVLKSNEEWSSQLWSQFLQLRKEALKKIQDFNGAWTRDLAIPVRRSTNWAMKPLALGAGQFWVHMFPWKIWRWMMHMK